MNANLMAYVPYVDTTASPALDFASIPGLDGVSLAFVIADADKDPSWGGFHKLTSDHYKKNIEYCKSKNIDLVCSFGGAAGSELALVTPSSLELYYKYRQVVDRWIRHVRSVQRF